MTTSRRMRVQAMTRRSASAAAVAVSFAMASCGTLERLSAPHPQAGASLPTNYDGIAGARFFPDANREAIRTNWITTERRRASFVKSNISHMLALSGGGGNGAYGAGILFGWTERGDRPQFDFVTGVSTGALIAPFAFLGSPYNEQLRDLYTSMSDNDVATRRPLLTLLNADSLADSGPLAVQIDKNLTDAMVRDIAAENRKGRVLLVGTTNLDLARPVVWNIGVIAASGHPDARRLIVRILLASASIPGLFPPVIFPVEDERGTRNELHADGGVSNQLFLYSTSIPLASAPADIRNRRRVSWIIRNGRFHEPTEETGRGLIPITTRSISALIAANALGDSYRTYLAARRDGISYNLTSIPDSFNVEAKSQFDQAYMAALFENGRSRIKSGSAWINRPPGFEP
jgi:Patatin-like phospholipase